MSTQSQPAGERQTVRMGIGGVREYTGREAARLIAGHPSFQVVTASSDAMAGNRLETLDPDLGESGKGMVVGHGDLVSAAVDYGVEVMLLAMAPQRSGRIAAELREAGIRVVDLSGAYRLADPGAHFNAYGYARRHPALQEEAVYGLSEWADPAALRAAGLVTNPGGFPCATLLALLPLLEAGLLDPGSLIVDAKHGTTGAGRVAKVPLLHSEIFGDFAAERVGCHRHTPEIVQELTRHGAADVRLTFVAHTLPVARGILVTTYFDVPGIDDAMEAGRVVRDALRARYADSPFIRVLEHPRDVHLEAVVETNRCLIAAVGEPNGRRVVLVSAVDNLVKGGAGQALQNANMMFGFDPTDGLRLGRGGRP